MQKTITVGDIIREVADDEPIIATATVAGPTTMETWDQHDADEGTAPDGWAWTPTRVLVVFRDSDGRTHVMPAPRNP